MYQLILYGNCDKIVVSNDTMPDVEEAWECVLDLEPTHYHSGPSPDYGDIASGLVIWVFKNEINGIMAYIKLKDETERRGCVCLSFHEDEP
ncbi:hypothetical protein ACE3MS_17540 [Paenibacillus dendritiformis]|uniref:hypothetical protein n=1 Tax=Paenibacillus dendritiformis TaxID=130049 RepID=UPI0036582939